MRICGRNGCIDAAEVRRKLESGEATKEVDAMLAFAEQVAKENEAEPYKRFSVTETSDAFPPGDDFAIWDDIRDDYYIDSDGMVQTFETPEEAGEYLKKVENRLVEPHQDNMLKITNDGRKLALDQRLINDMLPDNEDSKAATCVNKAFEIWEQTKGQKSTQLIFCDLSTPKNDGTFNVYEDIKTSWWRKECRRMR